MSRDWLAYFKAKRGMGAVICEGPEIEAACAEIEALLARHTALVDAVKWMLWIDTPENFEGGKHIKARAEVERLLSEEK